jgi:glutamate-1-semialdehyde aminotransferase
MFADMNRPALISRTGSLPSVSLPDSPTDLSRSRRVVGQAIDVTDRSVLQIRAKQPNVYFHPSLIEPWLLSTPHSAEGFEDMVAVIRDALASMAGPR